MGVALACAAVLAPRATAAEGRTGEQIYRQMCASCHGPAGEGTKENYPHPLVGERSVAQLARLIAKTMPDDDPGTCVGEDADRVAAYVHETFYSPTARARNKPARIELSRLTVRQYRSAVADLIASFRGSAKADDRHGLAGEYFKSRRFRPGERVLERLDPQVRFDFGNTGPVPDKFEPNEFSIRWQGSVLASETGVYEFVVRTEHAARLWVNDSKRPLIDAWVKSGNDNEYRGSIYLVGGRGYPLRLEFSKAKQGVDDSKDKKAKAPAVKASVALLWKPPHGVPEPIESRDLSPGGAPEVFALATPFPPDDRSLGWERGTTVSKEWDQATTDAAVDTAVYIAAHLAELAGVKEDAPDRGPRLRDFCRRLAERAFRRPLTDDQRRFFVDRQFDAAKDPELAVKRVAVLILKSPRFLYREADGGSDGYDVASRLAFGLWDSLPDQELLKAAAAGQLATRDQVARQAERMLADPRAHAKLREFLHQWLKIDQPKDLAKDPSRYPGFDPAVAADLRTSLDLFLDDVVWGEESDFRRLLLAESLYLNGRLAKFYGADLPADAPFQQVRLDPERRAGVLTHPFLMASFAYTGGTSPIHRGVFLARGLLGQPLRPPPEAFAPLAAELHPTMTTRERVALQTRPQTCQTCHGMINPLGFTFENFDAVGRYRAVDNGKPVDAHGAYQTRAGQTVAFDGPRDLATFLAGSEEVHTAFVEQLFQNLVKQPVRAYGLQRPQELRQTFAAQGFAIRKLVVEIMASSALTPRQAQAAGATVHSKPPDG
jgi:hypothetical protein